MTSEIATTKQAGAENLERVLIQGDLSSLKPEERAFYYKAVCESVGLNPLTQPFEYINLNGKLRLYAKKDCTDQLRTIHGVSLRIVSREMVGDDVYVVTAQATNAAGRVDESVGAVSIGSLKGEAKANAIMKAETKSKRRVTLSICGLGILDEVETDSIMPQFDGGSKDAQSDVLKTKLLEAGYTEENAQAEADRHVAPKAKRQKPSEQLGASQSDVVQASPIPPQGEPLPMPPVLPRGPVEEMLWRIKDKYSALGEFQRMKKELCELYGKDEGEMKYYDLLREYGVQKSDAFRTLGDSKRAARAMQEMLIATHTPTA